MRNTMIGDKNGNLRLAFLLIGTLALGVISTSSLVAQQQPLVDAQGDVREEAYDHLRRALTDQDSVYAQIDGRHLKTLLNEVVDISRQSRDEY